MSDNLPPYPSEPNGTPDPGNQPPQQPYGQQPYTQPGAQPPYGQPYGQQPGAQPPYGQPYGQQPFDPGQPMPAGTVTEGFSWGWTKFQQHVGPFLLGQLAYFGVIVVLAIVSFASLFGSSALAASDSAFVFGALGVGGLALFGLIFLAAILFQAAVTRVAVEVAAGRPVSVATFFSFPRLGSVLAVILLVAIASSIGSAFFVLPGIAVIFFAQYALVFVLDKGLGAIDAIKASAALALKHAAASIVLVLLVTVAGSVGAALCGVGVLVTTPLSMLATVWVYRRLVGETVAA